MRQLQIGLTHPLHPLPGAQSTQIAEQRRTQLLGFTEKQGAESLQGNCHLHPAHQPRCEASEKGKRECYRQVGSPLRHDVRHQLQAV